MEATNPKLMYFFKARITQWIDADTLEVHPLVIPVAGVNIRVRLKDQWHPEPGEEGAADALAEAIATLGEEGKWVWVKNEKHEYDHGRLVARVDRA